MGCSPWGCKESDTTEQLSATEQHTHTHTHTHTEMDDERMKISLTPSLLKHAISGDS